MLRQALEIRAPLKSLPHYYDCCQAGWRWLLPRPMPRTHFDIIRTFGGNQSAFSIALGDMDGDGHLDVIVGNYGQPSYVYLNDGQGKLPARYSLQWQQQRQPASPWAI